MADSLDGDKARCAAERVDGVSIIVPTYNRAALLPQSLATLSGQTVIPLEILVIDDGSTDGTEQVVASLPGPIRYIKQANGGKSSAVNRGLSVARGSMIWLFDDDDWAEPDAIEKRLDALKAQPHLGFVGAAHFMGHADPQGSKVVEHRRRMPQHSPDLIRVRLFEDCYFSLCSVLARRECFDVIGGFDASLKSSEDYDVLLRLASRFEFTVLDEPVFTVRQHGGVRGAGDQAYAAHQRREVFRQTDKRIGLKLRAELPLSGYVNQAIAPAEMSSEQRILALANRAVVMASKGLLDEMFQDLSALATFVASEAGVQVPVPADALRRTRDALMCDYAFDAVQDQCDDFVHAWRALRALGSAGRALAAELQYALWRLARMRSSMPLSERAAKGKAWLRLAWHSWCD